jgi:hypothetical protein
MREVGGSAMRESASVIPDELGFDPADEAGVYAEYVAMWTREQLAAEQAAREERAPATETSGSTPTMEELGLDPRCEAHCEMYDGYLMAEEDAAIERELAEEDAAVAEAECEMMVADVERAEAAGEEPFPDWALLTALSPGARPEHREFAALVLQEHARDREDFSLRVPLTLARSPSRVGPRRREHRARPSRRVRIRSGSRGDPPDDDADLALTEAAA